MKYISLISIPRSGSTFCCNLISSRFQVKSRNEIFNIRGNGANFREEELDYIRNNIVNISSQTDEEFLFWKRSSPVKLLDILSKFEKEDIIFKNFPHEMPYENVNHILKQDNVMPIILQRKPIYSYISRIKARIGGTYTNADTTYLKPFLDSEKFLEWYYFIKTWYNTMERYIKELNKEPLFLYYESLEDDLEKFHKFTGIQYREKARGLKLQKQDKNQNVKKRIRNWNQFISNLNVKDSNKYLFEYFI